MLHQVTVDLIDDNKEDRTSLIHQRLDRRWLGSLTIPFSSLYRNTRIEGYRLHFILLIEQLIE
jgi:coiled-coil and C2 domain-containing protein 2A